MKAQWTSRSVVVTLVMTVLAGQSGAEDRKARVRPEDSQKALAEAGKPGPAHAKLQPLVGSWTYTARFWMEPGKPPITTKGTIERQWILGGRFLEERVAGTGFDGKPGFEGFGLFGYDNSQKQYTLTWACNMGTGTSTGVGAAEKSGRFTFQTACFCPLLNKTIQGRDEIRIETEDRIVLESYKLLEGKEAKLMEIIAQRNK